MQQSPPNSITKAKLCKKLKICSKTLSLYLNVMYFNDLQKLGYRKRQQILLGEIYKYVIVKLVITED